MQEKPVFLGTRASVKILHATVDDVDDDGVRISFPIGVLSTEQARMLDDLFPHHEKQIEKMLLTESVLSLIE